MITTFGWSRDRTASRRYACRCPWISIVLVDLRIRMGDHPISDNRWTADATRGLTHASIIPVLRLDLQWWKKALIVFRAWFVCLKADEKSIHGCIYEGLSSCGLASE